MAVPNLGSQNNTFPGLFTTGRIPNEILKSGMTTLGKMHYIHRDVAAFSRVINTLYGERKQVVDTRTPRLKQISEGARSFPIRVASGTLLGDTATRHQVIGIDNDKAAELKVEDTLHVRGLYTSTVNTGLVQGQVVPRANGAQGTNVGKDYTTPSGNQITDVEFSRSMGTPATTGIFMLPEQVSVIAVGASDSAGAGFTAVTLERCVHSSDGAGINDGNLVPDSIKYGAATGIGANPNVAQLKVDDVLFRSTPSFYEGTGAPSGYHKNIELEENFTQEYKYAVEITDESAIEGTYVSEKPMDIHRWLMSRRMTRDHEFFYLLGRKGRTQNAEGKWKMWSGGVLSSIPQDSDHYIKYKSTGLNWVELMELGKEIFILGGSDERYLFTGYSLDARLRAMFYESGLIRINPTLTKKFNIEVNTLFVSGGRIHLIPSQIMEEFGYGMAGMCLDLKYPSYTPMTHKGWDMQVNKGPNGKGIQPADVKIYKEEVFGILGLERRYREYQSFVDFSNVN